MTIIVTNNGEEPIPMVVNNEAEVRALLNPGQALRGSFLEASAGTIALANKYATYSFDFVPGLTVTFDPEGA